MKLKKFKKGFTLIEILVVVSVLGILSTIFIGAFQSHKDKGKDLQVKSTLSQLQVKLQKYEVAPGVTDYEQAFTTLQVPTAVSALGTQLGAASNNYDFGATDSEFAIVFPLSNGKYYCVDVSTAKEVTGLLNISGPKNCDNATRLPVGSEGQAGVGGVAQDPTARTLTERGPLPVPQMGPYAKVSFYESLPRGYNDDPSKLWPLLIFMHGQGEQYPPLSNVLRHGVAKEINNGEQLEYTINGTPESFVVLMPQSDWWHPYLIDYMIEYGTQNYRIDTSRIYLTGLSSGTAGAITYGAYSDLYAQKIAAIGVSDGIYGGIASKANNPGAAPTTLDYCGINRAHIAVWMFYANGHAPDWTTGVRDILNACSPPPSPALKVTQCTTSVCTSKKRAWDQAFLSDHTYQNPNIYEWLFEQHR